MKEQILNKDLFWPTPIYWIDLSELNLKKLFSDYAFQLEKEKDSRYLSNEGGWQSPLLDIDAPPLHNLKAVLEKVCTKMMDLKIDWIVVEQIWMNINRKTNFNIIHNHAGYQLSGTYYVSVPENSGKIMFRNPTPGATVNPLFYWEHFQGDFQKYNLKDGMLLLWPSYLDHFVEPSKTDEPRISISFDINAYQNDSRN